MYIYIFKKLLVIFDILVWQLHIIHINKQLKLFQDYQARLSAHIGADGARRLVNSALFLITLGGNDFVNNYYLVPYSARSRQFSLPDYVRYLISEYRKVLRVLFPNPMITIFLYIIIIAKSLRLQFVKKIKSDIFKG